MYLRHVANEITHPWVGGADDEADHSMLAASNSLGERQDQFLQARGSECDSRQIQDKNLRAINMFELCRYMTASECRELPILE